MKLSFKTPILLCQIYFKNVAPYYKEHKETMEKWPHSFPIPNQSWRSGVLIPFVCDRVSTVSFPPGHQNVLYPQCNRQGQALESLFPFCWMLCAYIKYCTTSNIGDGQKPELFHSCINQVKLDLSRYGLEKSKTKQDPESRRDTPFPSTLEE